MELHITTHNNILCDLISRSPVIPFFKLYITNILHEDLYVLKEYKTNVPYLTQIQDVYLIKYLVSVATSEVYLRKRSLSVCVHVFY